MVHALRDDYNSFYFNRSPRNIIQLQFGEEQLSKEIHLTDPNDCLTLDWLLICLKEYHYQDASAWLASLITSKTKVAAIRNGIHLKDHLLAYAREENILEVSIDCPTQQQDTGVYWQLRKGLLKIEDGALGADFTTFFNSRLLATQNISDFKTASWKKLIESSALGAVLTLCGQTCHVFQDSKLVDLYQQLAMESIAVAKADGAAIGLNFIDELLEKLHSYPPDKGSSMLTDRLAGRPLEVDAKNGAISRLGAHLEIATPTNDWVAAILRNYDSTKHNKDKC